MAISFSVVLDHLPAILIGAVLLILIKAITITLSVWLAGSMGAVSLKVGLTLAQAGEFGIVILSAAEAPEIGLVTDDLFDRAVAVIVLTLMVTPAIMGLAPRFASRLKHIQAPPWWARHAQSFAARQRDAYERQGSLGWSFGAWKFDEATETSMHPAVLAQRSLRAASQAGWLPDLSAKPALPPCLRAPAADFALGDDTAPPSVAPPPPPPVPQDWPFEAAAPSGRVAAALGGFGCGALLMMMVAMASRKRGAATGYEAV